MNSMFYGPSTHSDTTTPKLHTSTAAVYASCGVFAKRISGARYHNVWILVVSSPAFPSDKAWALAKPMSPTFTVT